jgi:hypothetical protein
VSKADEAKAANNDENFRYHKKEIIKRVRAQAELSTAARIYLSTHRARPWVEEILNRDL